MRVIIAGSRTGVTPEDVHNAIRDSGFTVSEVICGGARGVDTLGEQWAQTYHVPVRLFPADWRTHGRAAGPIRNAEMAENADALIAVWDGESRGTRHMIDTAFGRGLQVYVYQVTGEGWT